MILILALSVVIAGCGAEEPAGVEKVELTIFAAASLTEVMEELARVYMEENENISIVLNLDSSGTLKTQIEEGTDCDIFISAAQKQMDELDINADPQINVKQLDFVLEGTRTNLLENKVVLAVPDGNPKGIASYDDLAKRLDEGDILMAMGNADVPVGQYTSRILAYYKLDEAALLAASGVITYASSVKEVATQVAEGLVDCGVIYSTDAKTANLEVVDQATVEMCGQIIYPAAVMKNSSAVDEAKAFLNFLTGSEAASILESFGFTPLR